MTPLNGLFSSKIRKIAADTDKAASISVTIAVAFGGANRPTLTKTIAIQKTKMISMGREMDVSVCSKSSQRV